MRRYSLSGNLFLIGTWFEASTGATEVSAGCHIRSIILGGRGYFVVQPCSGIGPPTFRRGLRNAEDFRGLLNFQTDEIAKLDQFSLARFQRGEAIQSFVECEQLVVRRGAGDFEFIHVQVGRARTAALTSFAAGTGDEDAAHGLGRGAKKMRAVLPRLIRGVHELEPRFMNERRGLQRVTGGFGRHLVCGHAAQFIVNERQQFLRSLGVSFFDGRENASDLAHASRVQESYSPGNAGEPGRWAGSARTHRPRRS